MDKTKEEWYQAQLQIARRKADIQAERADRLEEWGITNYDRARYYKDKYQQERTLIVAYQLALLFFGLFVGIAGYLISCL